MHEVERLAGFVHRLVRGVEAAQDVREDRRRDARRDRLPRARVAERRQSDTLRRTPSRGTPRPPAHDVERRHDVRVPHAGREPRLVEERLDNLRLGDEVRAHPLDGDEARFASAAASRARCTVAIPPAPICPSNAYGPTLSGAAARDRSIVLEVTTRAPSGTLVDSRGCGRGRALLA